MQAPSAIISHAWYLRFGAFQLPNKAVKCVSADMASQVIIRDRVSNVAKTEIVFLTLGHWRQNECIHCTAVRRERRVALLIHGHSALWILFIHE